MTNFNESYIIGFDLNDTGGDISVASICRYDKEHLRYELVKTLYGVDAEDLYYKIFDTDIQTRNGILQEILEKE